MLQKGSHQIQSRRHPDCKTAVSVGVSVRKPCHQGGGASTPAPAPPLSHTLTTALAAACLVLTPPQIALAAPPTTSPTTTASEDTSLPFTRSSNTVRRASILLPNDAEAESLPALPTSYPDLPPLQLPTYTEVDLPNGLHLVLLEDHEVPIIRGSVLIRGGQYASPNDKVGLASLSLALQRGGGSTEFPGPVLDAQLEEIAASIESRAGQQAFVLSFSSPSEGVERVLKQFASVIRSPALPAPRLEFYKAQVLDALSHQYDDADTTAYRKLTKLMYGTDSIYARTPTAESIKSITTDDVRAFLQKWERPDGSYLGIWGDFETDDMVQAVQDALGGWEKAPGQPDKPYKVQFPSNPLAPAAASAGKVFLIDRPGASQASVYSAEPGVTLDDPDATALDVLGGMLSSFGGALFDQIRSREGLAYTVSGGWQSPPGHPGLFVAQAETSKPGALLKGLRRVLSESATQAPSLKALEQAKEQRLNAFVFDQSSKQGQLVRVLIYDLLGLPRDLLVQYKAGLEAVQPKDLLAAGQRHLHPDKQVSIVVGDAKTVKKDLEKAGFKVFPLSLSRSSL